MVDQQEPTEEQLSRAANPNKLSNMMPAIAILGLLAAFFAVFIVLNSSFLATQVALLLISLVAFGLILGAVFGRVWFDIPTRIKYLNMIFANNNYHQFKLRKSGNRVNTYVVELEKKDTIAIGKKLFIFDSNAVTMEDGVPTIWYDERTCLPLIFTLKDVEANRSPELFSLAIQKERELARLSASNWGKALKMMLYLILGAAAIGLLVNVLTYFKVDDLAKAAGTALGQLGQQAVDAAKGVIK